MAKERLFEEMEKLEFKKNDLTNQIASLNRQIDAIAESRKNIESNMVDLGKTIIKYSTFFNSQVGPAIAELITTISGRKYIYKHARGIYPGKYGMDSAVFKDLTVVVDKTKYKEYYRLAEINGLINEGYAISIYDGEDIPNPLMPPNFFTLYGACVDTNNGAIDFNRDKFPYVAEFLKLLVQYAYERDSLFVRVCDEDVNACLKEILKKYNNACLKEILKKYKEEHTTKNPTKTIGKKIKEGE